MIKVYLVINCRQSFKLLLLISRLLYAVPAWGSYLSAALIGRIDAFLKRSFKYGLTTTILTVCELMDSASHVLFDKMQKSGHCLYM